MGKTDDALIVDPAVLSSAMHKLDFVGFLVAVTSDSAAQASMLGHSIAHNWKNSATHRDVVPLNASAETLLRNYNVMVEKCWSSTDTELPFVPNKISYYKYDYERQIFPSSLTAGNTGTYVADVVETMGVPHNTIS